MIQLCRVSGEWILAVLAWNPKRMNVLRMAKQNLRPLGNLRNQPFQPPQTLKTAPPLILQTCVSPQSRSSTQDRFISWRGRLKSDGLLAGEPASTRRAAVGS